MKRRYYRRKKGITKKEQPFFSEGSSAIQTKEEKRPFFQTKEEGLAVGKPGDKYEQEADAMANAVMSNSPRDTTLQRKEISGLQRVPEEEEALQAKVQRQGIEEEPEVQTQAKEEEPVQTKAEEEEIQMQSEEEEVQMQSEEEEEVQMQAEEEEEVSPSLQTKSRGKSHADPGLSRQIKQSSGKGQPLAPKTKRKMENAFGVDFSKVSIHTNSDAVQMNEKLHAQAFAHGNDVYFNKGKYRPESGTGEHLLAHELTHVVQQNDFIRRKEASTNSVLSPANPIVGLKQGDGLVFGTWHLRPRVSLLQQKLNEKMGSGLKLDGMFGPNTATTLRAFKTTLSSENTENTFISLQTEDETQSPQADFEPFSGSSEVVDKPTGDALMGTKVQKEIPLINSDVMFVLTPPPPICQSDFLDCWAAAAASWLNVTGILPGATRESLVIRFGRCSCLDGSLPEPFVSPVYRELGISLSNVTSFNYEFLKRNLQKHGHVILLEGGGVGHAVVAYAVGVSDTGAPDKDFYSIFDPIDCKYHNERFGSRNIIQIGRRTQPGARASCPNVDQACGGH